MSELKVLFITDKHVPGIESYRYGVTSTGFVYDFKRGQFLPFEIIKGGYLRVNLHLQNGGMVRKTVHQLVMLVMIGPDPDPNKNTVDHLNGNKRNNDIDNLEWVTRRENVYRAINNDQYPQFEVYLNEEDVEIICQMLKNGNTYEEISSYFFPKYSMDITHLLRRIYRGEAWKYISEKYMPFPELKPSNYKLTPEIVTEICEMLASGVKQVEITKIIAEKYPDLPFDFPRLQKVVSDIFNRKRWNKISDNYIFTTKHHNQTQ